MPTEPHLRTGASEASSLPAVDDTVGDAPPEPREGDETVSFVLSTPRAVDETVELSVSQPPARPLAHVTVAGYEILGELGRGGMGVVYKAQQVGFDRMVALKMILAGGHAAPDEVARFRTEVRAVARLQHPNIVPVYEVGEHEGRPYFSMEFCPGGLDRKLNGTPLPPGEAAALVETLARAMQAAHDQHVVHRDLKPANVLLTADGRPKISDFGLAKKLDEASQTQSGAIMGTPSYMAPEQAGGTSREVGPTTDVYALGAILYEAVTGRPPFRAATASDTIRQVLSDDPVPPRQLQPKVPRDLETICLKCLQKTPGRRYPSAAALADDLRAFREGRPVAARPAGRLERIAKWARRRPTTAALTTVAALAAVVYVVTVTLNTINERRLRDQANAARQDADDRKREAVDARLEADRRAADAVRAESEMQKKADDLRRALDRTRQALAVGHVQAAYREYREGYVSTALDQLRLSPPEERGWAWHCVRRLCAGGQFTLYGHLGAASQAVFSPDGRRLASAGGADGTVRLWDTEAGQELRAVNAHAGGCNCVAFDPDGRCVASGGNDGAIRVWDADTGEAMQTLRGNAAGVTGVAYSPDGRRLASAGNDGTVRVWDGETGGAVWTIGAHIGGALAVAYSPDGRRVASSGADGAVREWDAGSGRLQLQLQSFVGRVDGVAFSPDGKRLAAVGTDGMVRVWDARTGRPAPLSIRPDGPELCVAFSPDGRRLAAGKWDGTVQVWDMATGREALALRGHSANVMDVAFSPDGARLVSAGAEGAIHLWDVRGRSEALTIPARAGGARSVVFSPDGRRLAAAGPDGRPRMWDAETGRVARTLSDVGEVRGVAYSPNGKRLAAAAADGTVRVWDAVTGEVTLILRGEFGAAAIVAFSPDGKRLASAGGADGAVRVWDLETGQPALVLRGHTSNVTALAFRADGNRLASAGGADCTVRVWDAATGDVLQTLPGHANAVWALAYSPDGRRLTTSDSIGTIYIWDAEKGEKLLTWRGEAVALNGLAYSPDGRRLATAGGDGVVRVRDAESGQEALAFNERVGSIGAVAFSPDGRRLAALGRDGSLLVWDASPVSEPVILEGPVGFVQAVGYRPDGRRIATGGEDGLVHLWDPETGREVGTLGAHAGQVGGLAYSPDGRRLAAAASDGFLRLWDVETGQEVLSLPTGVRDGLFRVAFSPDGKRVSIGWRADAVATKGKSWDLETLHESETPGPPPGMWYHERSPDGFHVAVIGREEVRIYDTRISDEERRRRRALAQADPDWHAAQAAAAEGARQWYAVSFHLQRLKAFRPDEPDLSKRLGWAHAELGEWPEAVAELARGAERSPEAPSAAIGLDLVQYAAGQPEAARQTSRALLERCRRPNAAEAALLLLASPGDVWEEAACLRLPAERMAQRANARPAMAWRAVVWPDPAVDPAEMLPWVEQGDPVLYGALLYRAGRLDEAAAHLRDTQSPFGWAALALTECFGGKLDEAKEALARATQWRAAPGPDDPAQTNFDALPWNKRLELDRLCREAEDKLKAAKP